MDTLDAIDKLAQLARTEPAPGSDVCGNVLARTRYERRISRLRRTLTVACAVAASVVLVAGLWYWSQPADPLVQLYEIPEISLL